MTRTTSALLWSMSLAVVGLAVGALVMAATGWGPVTMLLLGSVGAGAGLGLASGPPFLPWLESVLIPSVPAVVLVTLVSSRPGQSLSLVPALVALVFSGVVVDTLATALKALRLRRSRRRATYLAPVAPTSATPYGVVRYDR